MVSCASSRSGRSPKAICALRSVIRDIGALSGLDLRSEHRPRQLRHEGTIASSREPGGSNMAASRTLAIAGDNAVPSTLSVPAALLLTLAAVALTAVAAEHQAQLTAAIARASRTA